METDRLAAIERLSTSAEVEEMRVRLLGKKGEITEQLKALGTLPAEERKARGQELNRLRDAYGEALSARAEMLSAAEETARLSRETIDVTLPVRPQMRGSLHPITAVIDEASAIFAESGFTVRTGPQVEEEEYNFTRLNIPESHPARQMHDTFYVRAGDDTGEGATSHVLRTHTSPVQIRTMLAEGAPLRIIAPGSTFRNDSDLTHTPMFHQIEGLVIDRGIHMGHLKGTVTAFLRRFFATPDLKVRFRPSFFPFTEPSAEVDIGCRRSRDALVIGEGDDWLEIMGCGMVHPTVLSNGGIDPAEWKGFAFGMGVERLAMLKYNIPDLRTFFESDRRWLAQTGFSPFARPGEPR